MDFYWFWRSPNVDTRMVTALASMGEGGWHFFLHRHHGHGTMRSRSCDAGLVELGIKLRDVNGYEWMLMWSRTYKTLSVKPSNFLSPKFEPSNQNRKASPSLPLPLLRLPLRLTVKGDLPRIQALGWTCDEHVSGVSSQLAPISPSSDQFTEFTGPVIAALPPNQGIYIIILHSEPGPVLGSYEPKRSQSQRVYSWPGCCSAATDHWSATFPRRPWWIAENRFVPACNGRWTLPRRPRSSRVWDGTILMKPKKLCGFKGTVL